VGRPFWLLCDQQDPPRTCGGSGSGTGLRNPAGSWSVGLQDPAASSSENHLAPALTPGPGVMASILPRAKKDAPRSCRLPALQGHAAATSQHHRRTGQWPDSTRPIGPLLPRKWPAPLPPSLPPFHVGIYLFGIASNGGVFPSYQHLNSSANSSLVRLAGAFSKT